MDQPLLLTPEQAAKQLGIGRAKMYDLLGSKDVESVKVGRCRRIPRVALDAYVAKLRGQAGAKVA